MGQKPPWQLPATPARHTARGRGIVGRDGSGSTAHGAATHSSPAHTGRAPAQVNRPGLRSRATSHCSPPGGRGQGHAPLWQFWPAATRSLKQTCTSGTVLQGAQRAQGEAKAPSLWHRGLQHAWLLRPFQTITSPPAPPAQPSGHARSLGRASSVCWGPAPTQHTTSSSLSNL